MKPAAPPLKRLLAAGNDLIAEGMAACKRDNPAKHAKALEFAAAGAFPRIIIDTHPGLTTVDFVLWGQDGELQRIFQYRVESVNPVLH